MLLATSLSSFPGHPQNAFVVDCLLHTSRIQTNHLQRRFSNCKQLEVQKIKDPPNTLDILRTLFVVHHKVYVVLVISTP